MQNKCQILKTCWRNSNIKMGKNHIKNCTCYNFDEIIKYEDFDFDILINEKLIAQNTD